jgi:hypothetical protein
MHNTFLNYRLLLMPAIMVFADGVLLAGGTGPDKFESGMLWTSSQVEKTKSDKVRSRREIAGHIFPLSTLFPSPLPSARFGFTQGVGVLKGDYSGLDDDGDMETTKFDYYGFRETFDVGAVFSDSLSFDLNAAVMLSGGMEDKNFTTIEASPSGSIKAGPVFTLWGERNSRIRLTVAPRLLFSRVVRVSAGNAFERFFATLEEGVSDPEFMQLLGDAEEDGTVTIDELFQIVNSTTVSGALASAIPSFTQSLVVTDSQIGIAPALGLGVALNKTFGAQAYLENLRYRWKEETKLNSVSGTESTYNYGLALSADLRHTMNVPVGITAEYLREGGDSVTKSYGLGIYYQGIGDVQLGLFGLVSKDSSGNGVARESSQTRFWMFNMTYFF